MPAGSGRVSRQQSFDDLGSLLSEVTFCVVDLETTGGSPATSAITEVGAVKVQGGDVVGEFATLVNPETPIPPAIAALTGITDALVSPHPPIDAVLPGLLEFVRGSVLVAHNARFDVGFLNANLERRNYARLPNAAVCTAALARRLVADEVRNCRLATLAAHFRCRTEPNHRALVDARATVEVFHALLERAGTFGVLTLDDLLDFARVRNAPLFKARRHLADDLPAAPGVYRFRSASGEVLYVGKATDLRARVRSYFGGDDRRKIRDLLRETAVIDHVVTPTALESAVCEMRLLHAERPRFNRVGKHPDRTVWLTLTRERFPRLSVVRGGKRDDAVYLGPLPSRASADLVADAIYDVLPLRRCTMRIAASTSAPACVLADLGRCLAPCDGRVERLEYAAVVERLVDGIERDPGMLLARLAGRMRALAAARRFEEATAARDRLGALAAVLERQRRLTALLAAGDVVAWRPSQGGTADVALIRRGVLVATRAAPLAALPTALADVAAAAPDPGAPAPPPPGAPLATVAPTVLAEAAILLGWLEHHGVRLAAADGTWALPVPGGRELRAWGERLARARRRTGRAASELAHKRLRRDRVETAAGKPV